MKKEWQQKAQALSRADMKKIKGGTDAVEMAVCNAGRACTINGRAGTCRINADDIITCVCFANQCEETAWGIQCAVGESPICGPGFDY